MRSRKPPLTWTEPVFAPKVPVAPVELPPRIKRPSVMIAAPVKELLVFVTVV